MSEFRVPRSAFVDGGTDRTADRRLLEEWRDLPAYVLLGDPGSGKTTALRAECDAVDGQWLPARDLVAGIASAVEPGRIVFIDGLDEVRAGTSDGRTPLDAIRKWLFDHGRPRFRLSCREADWRGENDRADLQKIAPSGQLSVLHLAPLDEDDIHAILSDHFKLSADERAAFLKRARLAGVQAMLFNPLLLRLTVLALQEGTLGTTRTGIYESACRRQIREHNSRHLDAQPLGAGDLERALEAAGLYCALILLSGKQAIALSNNTTAPDCISRLDLPAVLRSDLDERALSSLLFTVRDGAAEPIHRSVAEYLGARALAQRVRQGVPVGRVLALMQGIDGAPVEALRGLWAWLAVHLPEDRPTLIQRDPLGFVINADPAALSAAERLHLMQSLQSALEDNPWLRSDQWEAHPFGALVSREMSADLMQWLSDHRTDRSHTSFIDMVLDALSVGTPLPELAPSLAAWVEDVEQASHLRVAAYRAWKRSAGLDAGKAREWLDAVRDSQLADSDDELCGALLSDLYPAYVSPNDVMSYWHVPKADNLVGMFRLFWRHGLLEKTPTAEVADVVDSWARAGSPLSANDRSYHELLELLDELLSAALTHSGDKASDSTIFAWLGLGLDEHGFSRLDWKGGSVRIWLSSRPERIKALVRLGYLHTQPDGQGNWPFWSAEQRLCGAQLPHDWFSWQLTEASATTNEALARHCFVGAAHAAVSPVHGLASPSLEDIEEWLQVNGQRWPLASGWLDGVWWLPIDHWQGQRARRSGQEALADATRRSERKEQIRPYLGALLDGSAPAGLFQRIAMAYSVGFTDVPGATPLERVRNYLVCDDNMAAEVMAAFPLLLKREDMPTADEVLRMDTLGKTHVIRMALLLAARLIEEQDLDAVLSWPQSRAETLVTCFLTDGTGDMPAWYRLLVNARPEWVAPWLIRYARPKLKSRTKTFIAGLWSLGQECDHHALAQLVLPELLATFPLRASEPARQDLNQLLLAALHTIPSELAATLVRERLARPGMDVGQRISWLVANLAYCPEDSAAELADLVKKQEVRVTMLGEALDRQEVMKRLMPQLPCPALRSLIELLATTVAPADSRRNGLVTARHRRSDTVQALIQILANNPDPDARLALQSLATNPAMRTWAEYVQYHLTRQVAVIRSAGFHLPEAMEVAAVLSRREPANPADLRALVMDHLSHLQVRLRHGEATELTLFWRDDRSAPKIENICRDVLLVHLDRLLSPLNISVTPERHANDQKRMDLSVEFRQDGRRMALPVEIKRTDHDKLWVAWHDQLQRLYAADPAASGFGLYLVLWFGKGLAVRKHPEGKPIRSAEELKCLLEERIPAEDRFRIQVMVLDLSWPSDAATP